MSILQVVKSAEVSDLAAKFRKAKHGVDRLKIILDNQDLISSYSIPTTQKRIAPERFRSTLRERKGIFRGRVLVREKSKTTARRISDRESPSSPPLKPVSMPRLELQAAVMGCRLAASVKREMDSRITNTTYWTDSKTVLSWINADPRSFKPFVAHRLAEIEETSGAKNWRWVPSEDNVADDATRVPPNEFLSEHRWFKGPKFLLNDPSD
ncbi:hypothetical protein EVAR_103374_1 [Eumeta japonica]|uniref:Uncharacterized protein n=1 Tax=Eumeta variegata TaxID=151549 RepID=A0A4C1Y6F2_EUMVA|nr:hypothetical protein EVAR_103374_1 [Eumeta japonica]